MDRRSLCWVLPVAGISTFALSSPAEIVGFEDLPSPPGLTASTGLYYANDASSDYGGVVWDDRVEVVGKDYEVSSSGPLFSGGAPGGGSYYITNNTDDTGDPATAYGQAITLATTQVLMGAYFGSNEYYGYHVGEGATQVQITAMSGAAELETLTFDLVLNTETDGPTNTPVGMTYFDTSDFADLTGITGYVIDRTPNSNGDPTAASWVADNFDFAAVPEPRDLAVLAMGALLLAWWRNSRQTPVGRLAMARSQGSAAR